MNDPNMTPFEQALLQELRSIRQALEIITLTTWRQPGAVIGTSWRRCTDAFDERMKQRMAKANRE